MPPSTKRRSTRRASKNFAVIPDDVAISLLTLADVTVLVQDSQIALQQDYQHISADYEVSLRGHTAGEGPITIGVSSTELTVAEIKEAIVAAPQSQTDFPAVEHAKRPVRIVGSFPGLSTDEVLNDGRAFRVRFHQQIPAGKNLPNLFAFNRSGGPLTTGAIILATAKHYGLWK